MYAQKASDVCSMKFPSKFFLTFTETAINIGYSCQLLTDDLTDVFVVDATTYDGVETQLLRYLETIKMASTQKKQPTLSIVTFRWDKKRSGTLKETEYKFFSLLLINILR